MSQVTLSSASERSAYDVTANARKIGPNASITSTQKSTLYFTPPTHLRRSVSDGNLPILSKDFSHAGSVTFDDLSPDVTEDLFKMLQSKFELFDGFKSLIQKVKEEAESRIIDLKRENQQSKLDLERQKKPSFVNKADASTQTDLSKSEREVRDDAKQKEKIAVYLAKDGRRLFVEASEASLENHRLNRELQGCKSKKDFLDLTKKFSKFLNDQAEKEDKQVNKEENSNKAPRGTLELITGKAKIPFGDPYCEGFTQT